MCNTEGATHHADSYIGINVPEKADVPFFKSVQEQYTTMKMKARNSSETLVPIYR